MLKYQREKYPAFKDMMLKVAEDIVKNDFKEETVDITCSGGLDSLSTVLGLGKFTKDICLLHWNRGRGRYDDTLEAVTRFIADKFSYEVKMINGSDEVYKELYKDGVKKFVFSDGFDIAFGQIYSIYPGYEGYPYGVALSFSYGESFRSRHPVLDVLGHLPGRFQSWYYSKDMSGADHLMSNTYLEKKYKDQAEYPLEIINYDGHPLFIDFFSDYYPRFSDIFYRKWLCGNFIADMLGYSHNELVRRAWEQYKDVFKSRMLKAPPASMK
jgi:hypothetical protein